MSTDEARFAAIEARLAAIEARLGQPTATISYHDQTCPYCRLPPSQCRGHVICSSPA
jgi:hypothetical protein